MPNNDLISKADAIQAARHAWAKGLEPSQYIEIIPAIDAAEIQCGRFSCGIDPPPGMEVSVLDGIYFINGRRA